MLMSFKLLTNEKGKGRNVKFLCTWWSMAAWAFIYLLTISVRILFVTSTIIKCHTRLFQWNTATVTTVATAYPSSQLHPPEIVCQYISVLIKGMLCTPHNYRNVDRELKTFMYFVPSIQQHKETEIMAFWDRMPLNLVNRHQSLLFLRNFDTSLQIYTALQMMRP